MALSRGSETGVFQRPKGTSGPVKLGKGKASNGTESKEAAKPKAPASTAKPKTVRICHRHSLKLATDASLGR